MESSRCTEAAAAWLEGRPREGRLVKGFSPECLGLAAASRGAGRGMLARMEAAEIESALRAYCASSPPDAVAAWLFGSLARGTARPDSDVDLAILYGHAISRTLEDYPFDLQIRLERQLGRTVQVIVLDGAPPDLVHRVLRDGHLVFEADRAARLAFQVRARNAYFDLLPVLREYRRPRRTA